MSNDLEETVQREFKQLDRVILIVMTTMVFLQAILFLAVIGGILRQEGSQWLPAFILSTLSLVTASVVVYTFAVRSGRRAWTVTRQQIAGEIERLRAESSRARSLQTMAATLSATLSFERVMEVAMDVCSLALEEMGLPSGALIGAIFLFDGDELVPVANRRFISRDLGTRIAGKRGAVGAAIREAEPAVTYTPAQDPELSKFTSFQKCYAAVCYPLRAGYQIYGVMVFASTGPVQFVQDHMDLFKAVADQTVIALQNSELYQKLETEKQRIIAADEAARRALARDLHDGPTQSVAALAMHLNFIRSLMARDPAQAAVEMEKAEQLAKKTSKEIRGMLFTLRPLVLETQGLAAAVETTLNRLREGSKMEMQLTGGHHADLVAEQDRGQVFYIIEEALNNARKYSQAKNVAIRFWRESDFFVAQIQDDGVGFDKEILNAKYSSRGSLGMVNLRERAERINGSVEVDTRPGHGTTVTLLVPLRKPADNSA